MRARSVSIMVAMILAGCHGDDAAPPVVAPAVVPRVAAALPRVPARAFPTLAIAPAGEDALDEEAAPDEEAPDDDLAPLAPAPPPEPRAATSALRGHVRDVLSGEPAVATTVLASGPDGEHAAITDDDGGYELPLAPGRYALYFYSGSALWQREVTLGAAAVTLDQWIDPPAPVEVYAIDERAPDAPAPELDADAIPPPARTFEAVLGAAAGEQGDPIGGEGAWP